METKDVIIKLKDKVELEKLNLELKNIKKDIRGVPLLNKMAMGLRSTAKSYGDWVVKNNIALEKIKRRNKYKMDNMDNGESNEYVELPVEKVKAEPKQEEDNGFGMVTPTLEFGLTLDLPESNLTNF